MDGPLRVLHVDDDREFADLTAAALPHHGEDLTVDTAGDAERALELLAERSYDCVVSDYEMPGVDGLTLLERVHERHGDLPFVLFTGKGSEEVASEAISVGVTDYLQKGTGDRFELLANRVTKAVEAHRSRELLRERTERLAEQNERLEEAKTRYRSLFENAPVVIWEHDASGVQPYLEQLVAEAEDGDIRAHLEDHPEKLQAVIDRLNVVGVNEAALDYYEAGTKEQVIENFEELLTEDGVAANRELWAAVAEGERSYRAKITTRTFEGDLRHEVFESQVPDPYAEDLSRLYTTATDITERKRRERELERQNERLERFTGVVSHDLRNPLTLAQGRLDLAREMVKDGHDHLDTVADALRRMERLIDDLLTLAREGDEVTDPVPVDLAGAVEDCWATVETTGATLRVETGRTLRADPGRLDRLLGNLVGNAVAHGTDGDDGLTVTVDATDDADGFYVADDGLGFPDDPESALEDGYTTADEGTGFGLSIVTEIAEAHGWRVALAESADGGARVTVTGVDWVD